MSAPKTKIVHRAGKTRGDGSVSAVCSNPPRKIDLRRATWTLRPEAVTCPKCLALAVTDPAVKP